jgi:hypothetical protein
VNLLLGYDAAWRFSGVSNLRVYVIDDDPAIRDAISLLLKAEGRLGERFFMRGDGGGKGLALRG